MKKLFLALLIFLFSVQTCYAADVVPPPSWVTTYGTIVGDDVVFNINSLGFSPSQKAFFLDFLASDNKLVSICDNSINEKLFLSFLPSGVTLAGVKSSTNSYCLGSSKQVQVLGFTFDHSLRRFNPSYFGWTANSQGYFCILGQWYNRTSPVASSGIVVVPSDSIVLSSAKPYFATSFSGEILFSDNGGLIPPVASSHSLTVNYQYEGGGQAAPTSTTTVEAGADYRVLSPSIVGYTPDLSLVVGVMPESDLTITVTYTKNYVPPANVKLTIKYQYEDGKQAALDFSVSVSPNSSYYVTFPKIVGFSVFDVAGKPIELCGYGVGDEDKTFIETFLPYTPLPPDTSSSEPDPPLDTSSSTPDIPPIIDSDLVGFDPATVAEMYITIRANLGTIFSIAIYCFIIVLGVYAIFHFVDFLGR